MNTHDIDIELPPLPEWADTTLQGEDRDSLFAWARAAIEADRKRRGEPVAWWKVFEGQVSVVPASTFIAEDAIALGWRALVFSDAAMLEAAPDTSRDSDGNHPTRRNPDAL
jgi:hypothetical protein